MRRHLYGLGSALLLISSGIWAVDFVRYCQGGEPFTRLQIGISILLMVIGMLHLGLEYLSKALTPNP